MPLGRSLRCFTRDDLIAKPTPASRRSTSGLPFQNKVYPESNSSRVAVSERRVSDREKCPDCNDPTPHQQGLFDAQGDQILGYPREF